MCSCLRQDNLNICGVMLPTPGRYVQLGRLNNCFWSVVVFTRVQPFFSPQSFHFLYPCTMTFLQQQHGRRNRLPFLSLHHYYRPRFDGNNLQALGMLKLLAGAFCVAHGSRNTDAFLLNKPGHAINLGATALCSRLHVNKECHQLASQAARWQQQMLANGKHTPVAT